MAFQKKIFIILSAAMLYFCLYAVYNLTRGADSDLIFLLILAPGLPLVVVFALIFLLTRHAALAALAAGAGYFSLYHLLLLRNAGASGLSLMLGGEPVFAAGRLTEAGTRLLLTEYVLQTALLLILAALAARMADSLRAAPQRL